MQVDLKEAGKKEEIKETAATQRSTETAKEYTQRLKDVESATKWVDNFEKSMGYTAVCRHGYIDENGNFSSFAVVVRKDELNEKLRK